VNLKKALKQWNKENKETFAGYLTQQTEESIWQLKDEIERGIIHGQPFSLDIITTMASKPYNKDILREMLETVNGEIQIRNAFYLEIMYKYIQEALPILQERQGRELTSEEKSKLRVFFKDSIRICREIQIKEKDR